MLLQTVYVAYDFHLFNDTAYDFTMSIFSDFDFWFNIMYVGGGFENTRFWDMIYGFALYDY